MFITTRCRNNRGNRVSYNGGRGGVEARPTPQELAVLRDPRTPPVSAAGAACPRSFHEPRAICEGRWGHPAALVADPSPGHSIQSSRRRVLPLPPCEPRNGPRPKRPRGLRSVRGRKRKLLEFRRIVRAYSAPTGSAPGPASRNSRSAAPGTARLVLKRGPNPSPLFRRTRPCSCRTPARSSAPRSRASRNPGRCTTSSSASSSGGPARSSAPRSRASRIPGRCTTSSSASSRPAAASHAAPAPEAAVTEAAASCCTTSGAQTEGRSQRTVAVRMKFRTK